MLVQLFAALGAGYLLGQWAASKQHSALKNKLDNPRHKPDDVSNWEGEGGALPHTGSHLGPPPQLPSSP